MQMNSTIISLLLMTAVASCAHSPPAPPPPEGRGWHVKAQGYRTIETSASTSYHGTPNGGTAVRQEVYDDRLEHVVQQDETRAEEIPRALQVGRNVADYSFNVGLKPNAQEAQ